MKKIPTVWKRDYDGTRLVYNEVAPGCEWVLKENFQDGYISEVRPTVKWDGTACMIDHHGRMFRRHDRKPIKPARRRGPPYSLLDYPPAPADWQMCIACPDPITGHWPGWVPVGQGPEDTWHREAYVPELTPHTYELLGPKINKNPYNLSSHILIEHGKHVISIKQPFTFEQVRDFLAENTIEGIVFSGAEGMAKIKRRDFGFEWPIPHLQLKDEL